MDQSSHGERTPLRGEGSTSRRIQVTLKLFAPQNELQEALSKVVHFEKLKEEREAQAFFDR